MEIITKPFQKPMPNMADYAESKKVFSWKTAQGELSGLPNNKGLNITYEAVDRHINGVNKHKIALRFLGKKGQVTDLTYQDLKNQSDRFANVLLALGVKRGETVFTLAGRVPALYITALGTWKYGGVFCPLFSAFGPEPIFQRMKKGGAKVLVTTQSLYEKKVAKIVDRLPDLKYILLIDAEVGKGENLLSFQQLMNSVSPGFSIPTTKPEDTAILHFTSGTTGMPKGAMHVHYAVLTHYITGKYVLDFHEDDIFWCTADPGWVTGTSYGIIAPLTHGITSIIDEADFDMERWYTILEREQVNIWYTAPTAIRMLMKLSNAPGERFDLSQLRLIHSVGEPLNPEAVLWGEQQLGLPIHDNWWQTETGGIMIANYPSMNIKPGSMGLPLPGVEIALARHTDKGGFEIIQKPGESGELIIKKGWPSMFRGYLDEEERYERSFEGDWYVTGDLAQKDEDGYYWFVGRADDIIKTAGHMVGPFEVESALMEHQAVAEVAVIGKPDPIIGELVKAFVSLHSGYSPNEGLSRELIGYARKKLGAAVAPKEITFRDSLPKTRSGKIMRRLLRNREMGLPEGDTSTLETKL